MRKSFIIAACWFIPSLVSAQTDISSGAVKGKWTLAGSPYRVHGNIEIKDDSVLTIEPGVVVRCDSGVSITVKGTLRAIGTQSQRIKFSAADTTMDAFKCIRGWHGIIFSGGASSNNNDSSFLSWCTVEFSKMSSIYIGNFNRIEISHCTIRKNYSSNGGGMNIQNSSFRLSHSVIHDNYSDAGGGLILWYANCIFESNIFSNNRAGRVGGAVYLSNNSNSVFVNNIFCNNYCFPYATENGGAALYITQSNPALYNNTIVNNQSGSNAGGIFFYGNSDAKMVNCIIYGNTSALGGNQVYLGDYYSDPDFSYCDIQGKNTAFGLAAGCTYDGKYINNADISPVFESPTAGVGYAHNGLLANWSLKSTSPLINRGDPQTPSLFEIPETDFLGKKRIRYAVIDQGAIEFSRNSITVNSDVLSNTIWYADTVKVTDSILVADDVTLTIWPGVNVVFYGPYALTVEGTIHACGTPNDKIIFTYYDTSGFKANRLTTFTSWKGIRLDNSIDGRMYNNDSSRFAWCDIEYVHTNKHKGIDGAIYINNFHKVMIENCRIAHNTGRFKAGILILNSSDIVFRNNELYDNQTILLTEYYSKGAACYVSSSDPQIYNNRIYNNSNCVNGSGLCCESSNGAYYNNTIVNNISVKDGGGVFLSDCDLAYFYNNLVANNQSETGRAGGLYILGTLRYCFNNTIVHNKSFQSGGGVHANGNTINISNTILYGNRPNQLHLGNNLMTCILHNNNIEGGKQGFTYSNNPLYYVIDMTGSINAKPHFNNPTPDAGAQYNALQASFSLLDISSCINKGTNTINGVTLPEKDIAGNTRIQNNTIDIGAYENSGGIPEFTHEPLSGSFCIGDSLILTAQASDTVLYQWRKEGVIIPGATQNSYLIANASPDDAGNYSCDIINAYGSLTSKPAMIQIKSAPSFLTEPDDIWLKEKLPYKLSPGITGDAPLTIQWYKNNIPVPGANKAIFNIDEAGILNEGYYQCYVSNNCGSVKTDSIKVFLAPQICMVTVDSATGRNLIVWDKNTSLPVAKYNVYREGIAKGVYEKIGEVKPNHYTLFRDSLANPQKQAYWYKITAVDSAGTESDIEACIPHKTIHLLVTLGYQGGVQLDWDGYYGFPFGTYEIMRSTDGGKTFSKADFIASSNQTWSDLSLSKTGNRYFVSVISPSACNATLLKAESGPYTQSLSNIAEFKATSTAGTKELQVSAYPNPFSETLTLSFTLEQNSDVVIEVLNAPGQKTAEFSYNNLATGTQQIQLNASSMNISEGMCYVKIVANEKTSVVKCNMMKSM